MEKSYNEMSRREKTDYFNDFSIEERKEFLNALSETEREKFISDIRQQAVANFWTNERELIKNGQCTRDWTPEQIEAIMNFGVNGNEKLDGGKAFQVDENGIKLVDTRGNSSYYAHHMLDVSTHPEYAGDWRNIQALTCVEHYEGAHSEGTNVPTEGYYDFISKHTIIIDSENIGFSFEELGYPPKINSIFESDDVMSTIYENYDDFTDAEKLALKNVEYSISSKGNTEDFRRGLSIAEKYNSTDFEIKLGLDSQTVIQSKYKFFMSDVDDIVTYQIYEYYEGRNVSEEKMMEFGLDTDSMLKDKYQILKSCENPDTFDLFRSYEEYVLDITDISSNSIICFDNDGNVIDIIIDDVDDGVQHIRPSGTTFETTIENAKQHKPIYEVKSVYGIKTELTKLEQVMIQDLDVRTRSGSATVMSNADLISKRTFLAEGTDKDLNAYRAYEYLKSIGASDDTLRKTGILPDADLKSKYSFLSDCTDSAILDIFRANEYIKTNEIETSYAGKYASSLIHLDSNGKVVAIADATSTGIPSNAVYNITMDEAGKFLADDVMASTYEGYDSYTPLQKIQMQQYDYNYRVVLAQLDGIEISSATINQYLTASGKTADGLDDMDRWLMKMAAGLTGGNDEFANDLAKLADRCKIVGKFACVSMDVVDKLGMTAIAVVSLHNAQYLYEHGYKEQAMVLIGGTAVSLIGGEAGGYMLTGAISPYLMGFGAAIGGSVGATLGAVLSGVIGYSVAGFTSSMIGSFIIEDWDAIKMTLEDLYGALDESVNNLYGTALAAYDPDANGAYYKGDDDDNCINGGQGDNKIEGFDGDDKIYGHSGNDEIYGGEDDDLLYGDAGDDIIYGDGGDDFLSGGAGIDILYGKSGNDTYLWGNGDYWDFIYDSSGLNRIKFKGLHLNDLRVQYSQDNGAMVINKHTGETLIIPEFIYGDKYHNFELEFADGQIIAIDSPESPFVCNVEGTDSDDVVLAFFENSTLKGLAGNDVLVGTAGNDVVYSGTGDDYIQGGEGDDRYVISAGDGTDVINDIKGTNTLEFTDSTREDIVVSAYGENDAIMYSQSNGNVILLENFRSISGEQMKLKFNGSEEINANDSNSPFLKVYGTDEGETIAAFFGNGEVYGFAGNDTMYGCEGIDSIYGCEGNDIAL